MEESEEKVRVNRLWGGGDKEVKKLNISCGLNGVKRGEH